jgi:hypothetical protein
MNHQLYQLLLAQQDERFMLQQRNKLLRKEIGPKKSLNEKKRGIEDFLRSKEHDQRQQQEEGASQPELYD